MSHDSKIARALTPVTAGAVLFGAVVGGVAAAAGNARKVKNGEMTASQAALCSLREAGTTGIASGAGVAAMAALRVGGVLGLAGIAAVAAGTKYVLDSVIDGALAKARKDPEAAALAASAPEAAAPAPKAAPKSAEKPAAKPIRKASKPKAAPKSARPKAAPKAETFITE